MQQRDLGPVWFQKVVHPLFIFIILYSNLEFEYRKKHFFSHLAVFGKLFWIHNLSVEHIIPRFGHFFLFKKKSNFSHLHTHHSKKVTLCFHNIYEYTIVFIFIENENAEK